MTDDISMGALSGAMRERAEQSIAAGCDLVLHCNGVLDEMREIAAGVPELEGESLRRTEAAMAFQRPAEDVDRAALDARFDELIGRVAA